VDAREGPPKIYGDKLTAKVTGKDAGPIETKERSPLKTARAIAFILEKGRREFLAEQREAGNAD
jgi:hypothetical protein